MKIAAVIPCYKVRDQILGVLAEIGPEVDEIYCVDDACPDRSGEFIEEACRDPRVQVLRNPKNLGVGGAVLTGYRRAIARGMDVVVKVDGDGQMDPALLPNFVKPIADGTADYTKGNRFFDLAYLGGMPLQRRWGNMMLSFLSKISSGYWDLFDPTNGYTAVSVEVLELMPLDRIANRYFFESDMLFRLNVARARVVDVPMRAKYAEETSHLKAHRMILPFLAAHVRNTFKRIGYNYFLRDFNIGSLELVFGAVLLSFGIVFGLIEWISLAGTQAYASAGTVMLAALPIIIGFQLVLSALSYDIGQVPRLALHPMLGEARRQAAVRQPISREPVHTG